MKLEIGKCYYFKNPGAESYVGRLVGIVNPFEVELEDASWIADTGVRTNLFIKNGGGEGMEVEYYGRVNTRYQSVTEWNHQPFTKSYPEA